MMETYLKYNQSNSSFVPLCGFFSRFAKKLYRIIKLHHFELFLMTQFLQRVVYTIYDEQYRNDLKFSYYEVFA